MPELTLGAADGKLLRGRTEHAFDRPCLGLIAQRRARAVSIDVVDLIRCQICICQGRTHRLGSTGALLIGLRNVSRITAGAVP